MNRTTRSLLGSVKLGIVAIMLSAFVVNHSVKVDNLSIGTLDSITNPDDTGNNSSNPADSYINVYGSDNSGSRGELVLQTCGGYLYIDGSNAGDFFGSLSSFTVDVSGLSNGSHSVQIVPNNCGGAPYATGTNSLVFYVYHL